MRRPGHFAAALSGAAALAVAMGVGRFAFTPILPMMQAQSGLSLAEGGSLASANYVGYLVGALWAVRPAAPRVVIRAALIAIGLATLAMAFTHHFLPWLLLRFVAGVASAWALVHVSSWCLAQLASAGRPRLGGALFAGVGAGIGGAGFLCLVLMARGANATEAWLALGILSLGVTAALWPVLGMAGPAPVGRTTVPAYRWTTDARCLVACYGAFGYGYIIPATFVPVMAKAAVGDPRLFGWAWPIFGLTAAASTLLAARARAATSERALWRRSVLAMALGVAAPVLVRGAPGVLLAALLVGGTFMVITMAGMQEARRVAAERAPVLMAAMTSAFAAGQIAGPLSVPLLVRYAGFPGALLLASAVLVLSAALLPRQSR